MVADLREFNNLAGKQEAAAIESRLKAMLQKWMIPKHDYLPLTVSPRQ